MDKEIALEARFIFQNIGTITTDKATILLHLNSSQSPYYNNILEEISLGHRLQVSDAKSANLGSLEWDRTEVM